MSQEGNIKWNTNVEQVDEAAEVKAKEQFSSIPAEALPNTVYQKIMEDGQINDYLNNKYVDIVGAMLEVKLGLQGMKPIVFAVEAKKSDFMGSVQNEINDQITKLSLQGNQKIEFLNVRCFAYDDKQLDKPVEERQSVGGSWSLI